jgi:hypothetical protein
MTTRRSFVSGSAALAALPFVSTRVTRVPGDEGLRDVKIMTAIYEAARSGKSVDL